MKLKNITLILSVFLLLFSCEEAEHSPISKSTDIPLPVENVQFTPTNGGVNITYDLPASSDLLYVKAVYINTAGNEAEVKTSVFDNSVQILGFGDVSEKTIKLHTVSRSEVVSDPVSFTFTPLISPVDIIQQTLEIVADFGGVRYTWENDLETPISIELLAEDESGNLSNAQTQYTSQVEGRVSLRGFESVPAIFAAVIRDRYDNYSDTIYASTPDKLLTPLLEELLDKSIIIRRPMQNDDNWDNWGGSIENLFDDNFTNYAHTRAGNPRPSIMTIDLGNVVTLSRFKVHQRDPDNLQWAFAHGNPKRYDVYGLKELPISDDGNLDDWVLLKECEAFKPSGLPVGQNTDEDVDHFLAGDEFTFDEPQEIRYFRFVVHDTWDGAGYIGLTEMTFWGNVTN